MKRVPSIGDGLVAIGLILVLVCIFSLCNPRDSLAWGGGSVERVYAGTIIIVIALILIFGLPWFFLKVLGRIFTQRNHE
jgi:hypothetical protein